jgi:hypothetical protein
MRQREQWTSEMLRGLDEVHRLGRIPRDEYRRRRRELLESLRKARRTDRDTVRRAVAAPAASDAEGTFTKCSGESGHPRYVVRLATCVALLGAAGLCVALACGLGLCG